MYTYMYKLHIHLSEFDIFGIPYMELLLFCNAVTMYNWIINIAESQSPIYIYIN